MNGPCCKMSAVFPNGFANITPLRAIYEVALIILLFLTANGVLTSIIILTF